MHDEPLLRQLKTVIQGVENFQQSNAQIKADFAELKAESKDEIKDIQADMTELKIKLGTLEAKIDDASTRLDKKELNKSFVYGGITGITILTLAKYLFFN